MNEIEAKPNLLGDAEGVNGAVSDIPVEESVRILGSNNGDEGNAEEDERWKRESH